MGTVSVEGIKLYAYHGCMEEEAVVGRSFEIDVHVDADLTVAMNSDELKDTVDYVKIYDIVKREMEIRSKLLEHVGRRIIDCIQSEIEGAGEVELTIRKLNPPINGNAESVSVTING